MIEKLKWRFTLLVWATLLLVMIGVTAAINLTNRASINSRALSTLETLCEQNGERLVQEQPKPAAQPEASPPPVNENGAAIGTEASEKPPQDGAFSENPENPGKPKNEQPGNHDPGEPAQNAGQLSARLSNYFTVKINHDNTIESWNSDRSDLYSDEFVTALTGQILADEEAFGWIENQFYRLLDEPYGYLLIVLDMQLEIINAGILLRNTVLIGLGSWIMLSLGAFFLIRRLICPVQQAFDRQRQFVWDASHELKTPLAVISANAEVLSRDIGSNEWLGYIQTEISRTTRMINSLLTLAQIDQGAVTAQMKPIDLSRTVNAVLLPFESVIFEAGKKLSADIPDNISYTGDEVMIGQLVSILLGNAVKYADEGGTITVSLKRSGHRRILTVHNTGEGISPRDREHLFERFYRADSFRGSEKEGSGLGLAIAKSLTDAHHGRITAECPAQGGTLFTVILP